MFTWNVEEMALLNERPRVHYGNEPIFNCESTVSREDKIAFVDSMQDGKFSYLLGLIEKFSSQKESMPKDSWGQVKTVSLKAWIKKNDTRYKFPMINDDYNYGSFYILGCGRYIQTNAKQSTDTYDDLVDEVFHRQLKECKKKEKEYFLTHDEYSILKAKLDEYNHQYRTSFGMNLGFSSNGEVFVYSGEDCCDKREITMDELKVLLGKYEKLAAYIEDLSEEVLAELGQEDMER